MGTGDWKLGRIIKKEVLILFPPIPQHPLTSTHINKLTLINGNSLVKSVSVISLSSTLLKNQSND
ncbi:hypothetical protein ANSO36C_56780 [Nostoc cf. commune SO-36]|uniref:Uncharacterized protein n=1 Tax=Nostoc cf. commune SO-36 TaxID=449208 RepID=A0ABN6Q9M7_NOSCO|nr:hypothetical protein ANSO36C_56780 [Nostoc cf. commune SO-36]